MDETQHPSNFPNIRGTRTNSSDEEGGEIGLPDINRNRGRSVNARAAEAPKDANGRPDWNLRIDKPEDRKNGAWRMLDRDKMHINRSSLVN